MKRGNRSAVATPTRAVAAWRSASARRMSGRRRSRSDGSPTGTSGGVAGIGASARQLLQQRRRLPPEQHAEGVDRLPLGASSSGICDSVVATCASALATSSRPDEPACEAPAGDVGARLLQLEVLAGDVDLPLEAAEVEVVQRDLGRERDQHVAAVFDGRR